MPSVFLDTDVLIDYARGHAKAVALMNSIEGIPSVSCLTVAELYAGVREGAERTRLSEIIECLNVLALSSAAAARAGLFRRDYKNSHGVGLVDALIAATVIECGGLLMTLNTKHYPMLPKAQLKRAYVK